MVRLDKAIADLAKRFVLVRLINMRGVDLNRFDFDYDQETAVLFLAADGRTYGRFYPPSPDTAQVYLTLPALRHAMAGALEQHRQAGKQNGRPEPPPRRVEQYPAAGRMRPNACIHCHQVHEFRREAEQAAGRWKKDDVWIYPLPENVGLTLDEVKGNRVKTVARGSVAAQAGLQAGDVLRTLDNRPVVTIADVQYALQHAPPQGDIVVTWMRADRTMSAKLALVEGWRKSDLSWRGSLKRFGPNPLVDGEDLSAEEKKQLGLPADQLAFRQNAFPPAEARQAGIRPGDIIVGSNRQKSALTARQFRMDIQLNQQPGDSITLYVLRAGQRVDVPVILPRRPPF